MNIEDYTKFSDPLNEEAQKKKNTCFQDFSAKTNNCSKSSTNQSEDENPVSNNPDENKTPFSNGDQKKNEFNSKAQPDEQSNIDNLIDSDEKYLSEELAKYIETKTNANSIFKNQNYKQAINEYESLSAKSKKLLDFILKNNLLHLQVSQKIKEQHILVLSNLALSNFKISNYKKAIEIDLNVNK